MKTYFKIEGTYSKQEYEDKAKRLLEIDVINQEDYSRVLNSNFTHEHYYYDFTDFFYSENAKNYTSYFIPDLEIANSFDDFFVYLLLEILKKQGFYKIETNKEKQEVVFIINDLTYTLSFKEKQETVVIINDLTYTLPFTIDNIHEEICRFIESINFEERKVCKQISTTDSITFLVLSESQYEIMYNERLVCFDNEYYPEIEEWRKTYIPPF